MKISVVTISFNQAGFLKECIDSVLNQKYGDLEYIVVDPGSSDGSRDLIASYGNRLTPIFEKDSGPADGLNMGFRAATGNIFCYLNSDDAFLPGAFQSAAEVFLSKSACDVICGHGHIIDGVSKFKRKVYSDSFSLKRAAYGASIAIQPSTFFRREIFERIEGFNIDNKSNWDGELLIDMAMAGANIQKLDKFLSCYRVHDSSITGTGRLTDLHSMHARRMFQKIMNRPYRESDDLIAQYHRIVKHFMNPWAAYERILRGPIFGVHN